MGTFRIYRRLQDLQDVDPNGLPDGGVPAYDTNVSSFVVGVPATVGAFSMGVTDSGNTGGDTGVTGPRVGIVGSGNVTVLQSTDLNGGTITISGSGGGGAGFSAGVSGGNTQGDTGLTGTNLALAGGNNVTLSQATDAAGATITISGPNTVAQTIQTQNLFDLTAAGNTAGVLALVSSGTLTLAGGQSITLSQNGNAITISGASTSQSVQTQNVVDVTLSGNTAGALALVSSGTLTLAGGNNITLSQAGNAITISGANAGGAQTAISGIVASDATYTSGTVEIVGAGIITIASNAGQQVVVSATQSVQPETQTFVGGVGNSQITYTSGTVNLAGLGNVTVRSTTGQAFQISVPAQSVQPETQTFIGGIANTETTYTSGTVKLLELGAITIRSTTGNQFQLSVNAQTGTQFSAGISGGNTAGDTGTVAGRVVLAGGQSITLSGSTNGVSETISIVGATTSQSVQTQGVLSMGVSTGGNTLGNTGVATGSRMVIVGAGMITASQGTAAGASTITLNATQSAESQSIGMSNIGNTSGTTGIASGAQVRMLFAGVGEVTLSQSLNGASGTLSISAPVQTVESQSIGMSNIGNTSGTTGIASGGQVRFVFAGGNNITLSQSLNGASGTITISAPNLGAGAMSAGVSNLGNSAGATGITGTQLVLVGTNAISLSQTTGANGGTVSIDAPATSSLSAVSGIKISTNGSTISIGYGLSLADWENMPRQQASLMSHLSGFSKTPIYWNDHIDGDLTAKSLAFAVSMVTASQPLSLSAHLGVYSIVNSTSASLMGSVSEAYVVSSASSVSLSGVRNLIMTGIGTHATLSTISGGEYMIGMMFSATATNVMNASLLGASGGAGPLGAIHPGTNQLSTGTNQGIQTMAGRGSVTVNAMPANVAASDIINQGTAASMALHPWIYIRS